MEIRAGQVAVVTGAASGIGQALCAALLGQGCRVVAADVEEPALDTAVSELRDSGGEIIGVPTDVSDSRSVEDLATTVERYFGGADILCSNAGVTVRKPIIETTEDDWRWVLGVNLWGSVHALRSFLPGLLARERAHIVVTASVAGFLPFPMGGAYGASKAALVGLVEALALELAELGPHVGVTLLCPGPTRSRIDDARRNYPHASGGPDAGAPSAVDGGLDRQLRANRDLIDAGMDPAEVAAWVIDAIRSSTFYVVPHAAEYGDSVRRRVDALLGGGAPSRVAVEEIFGL